MNTNQQFASLIRPNAAECDYAITDVEGEIPRALNGSLYRNGPNQHVQPAAGSAAMSAYRTYKPRFGGSAARSPA